MTFWLREATLQIGANRYTLDTLNFSFEVPFEDNEQLPVATITAYNLSENTRASILQGHAVILNAGYEGDIGCIFIGGVAGLAHRKENTEWITKITATSATEEWLSGQVNKTYKRGIHAHEMLIDLLNIFGMEVGMLELTENKTYPRGYVCRDKLKDVIQEIAVRDCKSRMLISPIGQIVINNPNTGINVGYVLSAASGLLKATEEDEVIPIETDLNRHNDEEGENLKTRSCLLNYHIGPADIVVVQSLDLNGRFMVVRGRHLGSRDGDWKTEMELRAL